MPNYYHHPQVIRAVEMAREADLDPYKIVENKNRWREPVYCQFMDAAFEEHFARVAIDNLYWNHGGSGRWTINQHGVRRGVPHIASKTGISDITRQRGGHVSAYCPH